MTGHITHSRKVLSQSLDMGNKNSHPHVTISIKEWLDLLKSKRLDRLAKDII